MEDNTKSKERKSNSETFGRWYKGNKKTYNEKRRTRYSTDPEYRKRILDRAKLISIAKRQERGERSKDTFVLNGEEVVLYTSPRMAYHFGIDYQMMKFILRLPIPLPQGIVVGGSGIGEVVAYTPESMEVIRNVVNIYSSLTKFEKTRLKRGDEAIIKLFK